ncbi:molybdopterin-dependent oxidoreductase [Labilibaculum sp. A4]|uniref:molybdopterin-containing oxidoreductase family protein n=1 Tax=Labilibaculum euxinus TaxID=2686357 RepID=UPI000F61B91D|nr:molybdopterin-dependent oxidoreductase [Labilibaculum euxinus]MDQ1769947.1 molybdopterin-dependent oxidoreductase [Labilibaculum euxinus]MWN76502.1 molybdopterin-dependent oxidoreductase [Labilibaculum euxinus]
MKLISSACPRNCYSTCSIKIRVENNTVTDIEPHTENRATPEGPCIKGLAYVERANSKSRILYPQKRVAEGKYERISWEEALDTIAEKLTYCKDNFGPHSILYFASSGMSGLLNGVSTNFWKLFGGATTTYGNLCWPAGLEATRLTMGANKHNAPWDLEHAKLIVLWGKNPAETNIQEMIPIEKAQEKGAKFVVVDPRRTPSTERANSLFQVKSGTDAALALGLAREIIKNDWIDHEFIENNVLGFEPFKKRVEAYTIEKVSQICRISEDAIRNLAKQIGTIKPMTLIPGYGLQRYENGGQTTRCLLALSVITGNIGRKGGCWHYANLQSYVFDDLKEPESYFPGCEHPSFRRKISVAKLGEDLLNIKDPEVKFIWVERGNPLSQNPDTNSIRKAFRKADFRVVVEQFMTDTAYEADLILPAKNMFEQSDIIGSYWNPYVQLKQKVLEPAGEVKPETEIYYLLAKRLGMDEAAISKNIPEPTDEAIEEYLNGFLTNFPELSLEALKKGPQLANSFEEIPFADHQFPTPSGKIELYSERAKELWGIDPLPEYVPLPVQKEFPLQLISPNSKNRIHSQFGNLEVIKQFEPEAYLYVHPLDAEAKGIANREKVEIYNHQGKAEVRVQFDLGLRQGNVVLTNGHWAINGAAPNLFTTGKETDIGHGTAFHNTWVDIKRIKN